MSQVVTKATEPDLPTYRTIAAVLERKTGSGWKLVGWTFARAVLIAPPMRLVGVPWKKAIGGALLASAGISLFAMIRIYNAEYEVSREYFDTRRWARKKVQPPVGMVRVR